MKKKTVAGIVIALILFAAIGFVIGKDIGSLGQNKGVSFSKEKVSADLPEDRMLPEDVIQVYLFHSTHRCATCIAVGKLARETVNEYYPEELANGRIEFREINLELAENQALVNKFQASGSSLFINVRAGGKDNIAEDVTVWRLTKDEVAFKQYLKEKLDNLLSK
jgi:hypothetical protein